MDPSALSDDQTIAFRSTGGVEGASSPWAGLFRLIGETGPEEIASLTEEGLPLPVPTEWRGGPEPMPAGDVACVPVVDLSPGRYAWITVAALDTSGMVKTFTVEAEWTRDGHARPRAVLICSPDMHKSESSLRSSSISGNNRPAGLVLSPFFRARRVLSF